MHDKRMVNTQEKPSKSAGYINMENDPLEVLPVMVEDEASTPPSVESSLKANKRNKGTQKGLRRPICCSKGIYKH